MPQSERLVVLLAFLLPFACIPALPDGAEAPRWALMSVLVPAAAWLRVRETGTLRLPIEIIALIGWMALGLIWSPDPVYGLDLFWRMVLPMLLIALAPADMRLVYWAVGLGLLVNAGVVALQLMGHQPVPTIFGQVASGLFFNKNRQNDITALAIVGLLSLRCTMALFLAVAISLPLMVLPLSRAPLIGMAVVTAFAIRNKYLKILMILSAAGLLIWLVGTGSVSSNSQRVVTWQFLLGWLGPIGYGAGSTRFYLPDMEYAHNDLLQLAFELGVPGLLCIAAMAWRIARDDGPERLVLVAFATIGLFDFPLYQPCTAFLAALAFGAVVRRRPRLFDAVACGKLSHHARKIGDRLSRARHGEVQDGRRPVPAAQSVSRLACGLRGLCARPRDDVAR